VATRPAGPRGAPAAAGRVRRTLSTASRATLSQQRDDAMELLKAAGWRVAVARADQSVADVWATLGESGTPSGPSVGRQAMGAPA
jgi:hypothetical protein